MHTSPLPQKTVPNANPGCPVVFVGTADAAVHLGVHYNTMTYWRRRNRGPTFRRVGHKILYAVIDLDTWNAARVAADAD